jgi:cysteine desulfurase family protein
LALRWIGAKRPVQHKVMQEDGTVTVYLDNAATSYPKPEVVYTAMDHYGRTVAGSPGRAEHQGAAEATRVVNEARGQLARLFNAPDPSRVVFTANATHALNLALKGLLRPGDHVVTSSVEHNAVWRPLKALEREGVELSAVACTPTGLLDPASVAAALRRNTRLIVVTHGSNVLGTVLPISELGEVAHRHGLPLLVDAAQTAGVYPIDVEAMGVDLLAFTGHKGLLGPTGTGGLVLGSGIDLEPLLLGGTGGDSSLESMPPGMPEHLEAGTLNGVGIAGLSAGVGFLLEKGVESVRRHEVELTAHLLEGLAALEGVTVYGPPDPEARTAVVSINLEGCEPEQVSRVLDEVYDVATRAGLHCAPQAHRTMGTLERGALRLSAGYFTTHKEIDYLLGCLREILAA